MNDLSIPISSENRERAPELLTHERKASDVTLGWFAGECHAQ